MKDILSPLLSGVLSFLLGYLGFRSKNKEVKVSETAGIIKSYNDLGDTYRLEIKRRDERIASLEDQLEEQESHHRREKIQWARALQERLREQGKGTGR